jgi:hypothetical protein
MQQEAADELRRGQPHDLMLGSAALAIILPAKADVLVVEIDLAAVADRDV